MPLPTIGLRNEVNAEMGLSNDCKKAKKMHSDNRFGVPRKQELLTDVRSALDNWAEHAKAAGLSQGKT
jgi:hypothetical protein